MNQHEFTLKEVRDEFTLKEERDHLSFFYDSRS